MKGIEEWFLEVSILINGNFKVSIDDGDVSRGLRNSRLLEVMRRFYFERMRCYYIYGVVCILCVFFMIRKGKFCIGIYSY